MTAHLLAFVQAKGLPMHIVPYGVPVLLPQLSSRVLVRLDCSCLMG